MKEFTNVDYEKVEKMYNSQISPCVRCCEHYCFGENPNCPQYKKYKTLADILMLEKKIKKAKEKQAELWVELQ